MSRYDTVYDVMVIGAGFAGMAATLFAAQHGLSVAQTGSTGGIDFSTGFLDLMAIHPTESGTRWKDPWAAIDALRHDALRSSAPHPYTRISREEIQNAMDAFTNFLASRNLAYTGDARHNTAVLTPAGTIKHTWRVPVTTAKGAQALQDAAPTLIVDFHGLKGFSARQIQAMQAPRWPSLRAERVAFPGTVGELYPEHMAWTLGIPERCEELAALVAPLARDVDYIGFPAVLGLHDPVRTVSMMEELTGKSVFEIPTLPPSVTGPRLRSVFDRGLAPLGVTTFSQKLVQSVQRTDEGLFRFSIGDGTDTRTLHARGAILASGRLFGKGLRADRNRLYEPLFDIPVTQPQTRAAWHRETFLDSRGHPVNRAGIEVDDTMRPLTAQNVPLHDTLFAAGAILAHHDWMRQKCGAGLAIATAARAVKELAATLGRPAERRKEHA